MVTHSFKSEDAPILNMCGFMYTGADLGGFGGDTTRDLLLRFLALGVFTPLMRDHAAEGTREQECYQSKTSKISAVSLIPDIVLYHIFTVNI